MLKQQGRRGKRGIKGAPGRVGRAGRTGLHGAAGSPGKTGATGLTGLTGKRGAAGAAGAAGVSRTVAAPHLALSSIHKQIENVYRALDIQMKRMAQVQAELDDVRDKLIRLTRISQ